VKEALGTRQKTKIEAAKRKRNQHHEQTRKERKCYYARRDLARADPDGVLSLILDKWDSAKTTCPFFARAPGAWWNGMKHDVLEQHVLGLMIHGVPNKHYFYTINTSIGSGANLNIEGIRQMLAAEYATKPLPRTIHIQSDNASDNKCWTMLLWLAMLVYHDYTGSVEMSFLIVGHTHEDIDQLFSTISRWMKGLGNVLTPQQFDRELTAAMGTRHSKAERMQVVAGGFEPPSLTSASEMPSPTEPR
jgi:hypothetical protein